AGLVLDGDLLAHVLAHLLRDDADHHVDRASRLERHQHEDRLRRVLLGRAGERYAERRRGEKSIQGSFVQVSPPPGAEDSTLSRDAVGSRMPEKYLEDLAPGQKYGSGRLKVEEARIRSFAAEFDPQPFHTDPEAARRTMFGGLAASGWHTAAMTMRL